MKLGVLITAFNEPLIVPLIEHYKSYVDKIVVTVSKKPWMGNIKADDTYKRAKSTGVTVINKDWRIEHEQRNEGMKHLKDMDYVIVSHADTWFTVEDLKKLKTLKLTDLHYACNTLTFWKDYETVIDPDIYLPTIIVRSDAKFNHLINIEDQKAVTKVISNITCYHLSWVKTDEELLKKINSYSHAQEIDKNWFKEVWLQWKPGMTNIAPTVPSDYKGTRKHSLPKEIRKWQE